MISLFLFMSPEAMRCFKSSADALLILSIEEIISMDAYEKFILLNGDVSLTQVSMLGSSFVGSLRLAKISKIEVFRPGVFTCKR